MIKRKTRRTVSWMIALCLLVFQVMTAGPALGQTIGEKRLAGGDRYQTAVSISQKGWKSADYAVLARGDNFADALCAGPLAAKYQGPILLTEPGTLNAHALKELKRLGVKHLFLAGGPRAISPGVEDALKAAGIKTIERIFGESRYETSVKIAEKVGQSGIAVLATGSDYPDALSISAIAAKQGMPILLTGKDRLPDAVRDYLRSSQVSKTYIVGGNGVIADNVASSVPGPVRLAGSDRYDTNIAVMEEFKDQLNVNQLYVAIGGGPKGNEFADALTGAVLAAKSSSPLVLTASTLPPKTAAYLQTSLLQLATKVTALGGQGAVPASVLRAVLAAKEKIPAAEKFAAAGTYGPETGKQTIAGNVTVSAAGVILRNLIIEGDLLLGQSIGDGNVTLNDVTVKGKTIVNGGGPNSVIMYNFNGESVVVDVPEGGNVRLVAQGNSNISSVSMEANGKLEEEGLTAAGFVNVVIPAGAEVILTGSFAQVDVQAAGANITVTNGTIATMNIADTAAGAGVNLAVGASVTTLNANASSSISGEGRIGTANVNAPGVAIAQTPATTNMAEGITGSIGGEQRSGTTTGSGGGGGGGGGGPTTIPVTGISLNPTSMFLKTGGTTGTIAASISPNNATNQNVSWSSSDPAVATVENGVVTPVAAGTAIITAISAADNSKTASCLVTVGAFIPGEGGNLPVFPSFTAEENKIAGLYVTENSRSNYVFVPGTYAETYLKFPSPSVFGATGYTLQFSSDGGNSWANYQISGVDLTTGQADQDNFVLSNLPGAYELRLLVNGGEKDGYTSNRVNIQPAIANTYFSGYTLDESVFLTGIMAPYAGRGLEASFSVGKLEDNSEVVLEPGYLTYQWYRVNPLTFEMTAIPGATDLSYTTTEADIGYRLMIRATGDEVHVGGFIQVFSSWEILAANKAFVSNVNESGFSLNLEKSVGGLTANDLELYDKDYNSIPISSVTPIDAGNAIFRIEADMPAASGPYRLYGGSVFWKIISAAEVGGHSMEGIQIE